MKEHIYQDMIAQHQTHWWFKARRKLLQAILEKYIPSGKLKILEVGCGTGGNLKMLKQYGKVSAMEMDIFAADYAAKTTNTEVKTGWLPDNIPFTEKFDVICLFDVLEHIADDKAALLKIAQFLNPDGIILLTVPSHQWLYGIHDKMHYHFRRYSSSALKKIIPAYDMEILKFSHFNFILFPFLVLSRLMDMISKSEKSTGYQTPGKFLNILLYAIFSLETHVINKIDIAFGGSAFAVVKSQRP